MEVLGYLAIIGIGIVLGSTGAGGSMLAIPVLVYLFSLDMETASAYSLFLVGITSLAGAALKQKEHLVSVRTALLFGIPSIIASFVSRKWIVVLVPDLIGNCNGMHLMKHHLLLGLFSLLMMVSSITILLKKKHHPGLASRPKLFLVPVGFLVGLIAGLAGVGGGFLILPALIILAGLPFAMAAGTSLLIIASNSLLGFCGDLLNRPINWYFLSSLTGLAILGLFVGCWSHKKVSARFPGERAFAWFVLTIAITIWVNELMG